MNSLYYKNVIKVHLKEKRNKELGFMVFILKLYENKTQDYYTYQK